MKAGNDNIGGSSGYVFQINASKGGVPKLPLPSAEVNTLGLVGDKQGSPEIHGGTEQALCLYSLERIQALQTEGNPIYPGAAGENLTISGLDWSLIEPGTRLRLGSDVLVEITFYTSPCNNIAPVFKGGEYGRISQTRHPGWSRVYARVLTPGRIQPGDKALISD